MLAWYFRDISGGSGPVLLRYPIFCDFSGGCGPHSLPPHPPSGSAHACYAFFYLQGDTFLVWVHKKAGIFSVPDDTAVDVTCVLDTSTVTVTQSLGVT